MGTQEGIGQSEGLTAISNVMACRGEPGGRVSNNRSALEAVQSLLESIGV